MFGGLEKFLQLRRGLQQDTENREFLEQDRAQKLELGKGEIAGQGIQNTGNTIRNKYLEPGLQTSLARDQAATFGPEGVALKSIFGENADTSGFQKGLARQIGRQDVADQTQVLNRDNLKQNVDSGALTLGAKQELFATPDFNAVANPAHAALADKAGMPSAKNASDGTQENWRAAAQQKTQEFQASENAAGRRHSSGMQAAAIAAQIAEATATIPAGVDRRLHTSAMSSIKQYEETSQQLQQQLAMIQREIDENQTRATGARMGGDVARNAAALGQVENYIRQRTVSANKIRAGIRAQGQAILDNIKGLGVNDPLYSNLVNSIRMGAEDVPVDGVTVGGRNPAAPAAGGVRVNRAGVAP